VILELTDANRAMLTRLQFHFGCTRRQVLEHMLNDCYWRLIDPPPPRIATGREQPSIRVQWADGTAG
jgi:hypothetical protein